MIIQEFVTRFMAAEQSIKEGFRQSIPDDYEALVRTVIESLRAEEDVDYPLDATRIHQIDDGDYQGTLVFVIATEGYQPSNYCYVKVSYGSCSACDSLEAIKGEMPWDEDTNIRKSSEETVSDLWKLALGIVQGLRWMEPRT